MTEAQALRAAIKAQPGVPLPAMMYADCLADMGHERMADALRERVRRGPLPVVMANPGRPPGHTAITVLLGKEEGAKNRNLQAFGEYNEWGQVTAVARGRWPLFEEFGELLLDTQPLRLIELDDLPDLRITRNEKEETVAWRLAMRADLVEFNSELELHLSSRRHHQHTTAVARQLLEQFAKPWPGVLIDIAPRTEVQWRRVGYDQFPPWRWREGDYDDIVVGCGGDMERFEEWAIHRDFDGKRWWPKNRHN